MSAIIVKDKCLGCRGLNKIVEFGACDCSSNNIGKSLSGAQVSWLRRHGKLSEVKKPLSYTIEDVEVPLKRVLLMAQKLADESSALASVTKGINDKAQKRKRGSRVRNAKIRMDISVSGLEKSKALIETVKKKSLQKSDNFVVLGVLNGSLKSMQIEGWVEKRAGVR